MAGFPGGNFLANSERRGKWGDRMKTEVNEGWLGDIMKFGRMRRGGRMGQRREFGTRI